MADELIDIYDEHNNPLGIQKMKSEAHRDGLWLRSAHVWIYNSQGEVLLQLRAKEKKLLPNVWDVSAAGHVSAGEEPIVSALREVQEEVGLKLEEKDVEFFEIVKLKGIYGDIDLRQFCYVYLVKYEGDISQLSVQEEEVQEVKFFSPEKVLHDVECGSTDYVPVETYWLEVFAEIKKRTQ